MTGAVVSSSTSAALGGLRAAPVPQSGSRLMPSSRPELLTHWRQQVVERLSGRAEGCVECGELCITLNALTTRADSSAARAVVYSLSEGVLKGARSEGGRFIGVNLSEFPESMLANLSSVPVTLVDQSSKGVALREISDPSFKAIVVTENNSTRPTSRNSKDVMAEVVTSALHRLLTLEEERVVTNKSVFNLTFLSTLHTAIYLEMFEICAKMNIHPSQVAPALFDAGVTIALVTPHESMVLGLGSAKLSWLGLDYDCTKIPSRPDEVALPSSLHHLVSWDASLSLGAITSDEYHGERLPFKFRAYGNTQEDLFQFLQTEAQALMVYRWGLTSDALAQPIKILTRHGDPVCVVSLRESAS